MSQITQAICDQARDIGRVVGYRLQVGDVIGARVFRAQLGSLQRLHPEHTEQLWDWWVLGLHSVIDSGDVPAVWY